MEKAKNCFKDADVLLKACRYNACISRCYYALFHAASAFLKKLNIPSEKRAHRFVISAFMREYVHRRKSFKRDAVKFMENTFFDRRIADYDLHEFSEKETKRIFDKTKRY